MDTFHDLLSRMNAIMATLQESTGPQHIHAAAWVPLADVYEGEDAIVIVMELPGIRKEDVHVSISRGVLRVAGFRHKHLPKGTRHVHQMEIPYGHFSRSLELPGCADLEHIEAKYKHAYLLIEVPRHSQKS